MKPAFALSFSENGISLHHQSDGDWYSIGTVPLDTPHLAEQMQALRDQGFALANHLGCALIIPPDQVRLLSVDTNDLDAEAADQKIRQTLTEATPYALSELAYTTRADGTATQVAAVARQTLAEAQTFAASHGFIAETFCASATGEDALSGPVFEWPVDTSDIIAPESAIQDASIGNSEEFDAPTPLPDPAVEDQPEKAETTTGDEAEDAPAIITAPEAPKQEVAEDAPEASEPEQAENTTSEALAEPETESVPEAPVAEDPVTEEAAPEIKAETPPDALPEADGTENEPDMPVHAIAGAADPAAFRSTPQAKPESTASSPNIKRFAIPAVAASVILGMAIGAWSVVGPDDTVPEQDTAQAPPEVSAPEPEAIAATEQPDPAPQATTDESDDLSPTDTAILEALGVSPEAQPEEPGDTSATDAAILEALKVEPEQVEPITQVPSADAIFNDFTGTAPSAPPALTPPAPVEADDIYLTSIDPTDLSLDALALPAVQSLDTDRPFDDSTLPGGSQAQFELDDRGLVTASPDGTLNPDGIMIYAGRPSKVPPEPPVRFEAEPEPNQADQRLAGLRPRPRPDNLVDQFERSQLGGRSREELAIVRPKARPESLKIEPQVDHTPTALAVVLVPRPKARPANLRPRTASAGTATLGSTANVATGGDEAGSFQPKTVKPKIPTTASVARQATIDNAINLRRLNLIGVYGTPANRRALVRLPSGRYKKLKVGDRLDGGKVVAIGDSELRYQKRGQNVTLKMPRG